MSDSMTYRKHLYEVRDGAVWRDGERLSKAAVLRVAKPGTTLREWLRERGVDLRASGQGGVESRNTVQVLLRLPPDVADMLEALAKDEPKNAIICRLIRAADKKS